MAMMKILAWPNPYLRKKAAAVTVFDDALKALVLDMERTMIEGKGIGLAATQVGLDMRMVLLDPFAFEGEEGAGKPNVVLINPAVIWKSEQTQTDEEGCLSFPGVYIQVSRPQKVRISAQDVDGQVFEIEGEALGARAILHELDHLEGIVMVDHVSHFTRRRALKKHQRNQAALEADTEESASGHTSTKAFGKASGKALLSRKDSTSTRRPKKARKR